MHHPSLEDTIIATYVGPKAFQNGREYCNEKWRIAKVSAKENNKHLDVLGYITGSLPTPYEVWVVFSAGAISQTSCSCPAATDGKCKHVACLLLYFRENEVPRTNLDLVQLRPFEKKDRFPNSKPHNSGMVLPAFPDSSSQETKTDPQTPRHKPKAEKPGFSLGDWSPSGKKKKFHLSSNPVDLSGISPTKGSLPQIITPIDPNVDLSAQIFQTKFRCFVYAWRNHALKTQNKTLKLQNQQQAKKIQDLQTQLAFLKTQYAPTKSHAGNKLIGSYETTSLKFSCSLPQNNPPLKKRKLTSETQTPTKIEKAEHVAISNNHGEPTLKRKHSQLLLQSSNESKGEPPSPLSLTETARTETNSAQPTPPTTNHLSRAQNPVPRSPPKTTVVSVPSKSKCPPHVMGPPAAITKNKSAGLLIMEPMIRDGAKVIPIPSLSSLEKTLSGEGMELEESKENSPSNTNAQIPTKLEPISPKKTSNPTDSVEECSDSFSFTQPSTQVVMNLVSMEPQLFAEQMAYRVKKSGISNDIVNQTLMNMKSLFAKYTLPVEFKADNK